MIKGVPTPSRTLPRIPEVGERKKVGEERREDKGGEERRGGILSHAITLLRRVGGSRPRNLMEKGS